MEQKILILFLLLILNHSLFAQDHEHQHNDEHEHDHEKEHRHNHEIGVSAGPVYFFNAEELSFATHLHYTYSFPDSKFGLGVGYERVFDEHKHNFVGIELSYRIIHPLMISLSPGVVFEGAESGEAGFGVHTEVVYEFELGAFHVGPMVELVWHPEDWHLSLGVHVGLGF